MHTQIVVTQNSFVIACTELQCPNGSICRVCNHTGMPYCEYSCTIDNGGCSQGARCVEQTAECASDECCSPVVTCGSKFTNTCAIFYDIRSSYKS